MSLEPGKFDPRVLLRAFFGSARYPDMSLRRLAQASLGLGGLILMGMGGYFAFLRPPLLPEDLRYVGTSLAQIQSAIPGFLPWVTRVFGVLGGYIFATGLLTAYLAAASFRDAKPLPTTVVVISGLVSIGWMAVTNFLIDSDFKWLLLAFVLPWLVAVVASSAADTRGSKAQS